MLIPTILDLALLSVIVALVGGDEAGWDMGHLFFSLLKVAAVWIFGVPLLSPFVGEWAVLLLVPVAVYLLWQDLGITLTRTVVIFTAWLVIRAALDVAITVLGWKVLGH